jgi:hypothetical protein
MQENVNFGKEMARLKEQLKEKINWNQVDLVMVGCYFCFVIKREYVLINVFKGQKTRQFHRKSNWKPMEEFSQNQEEHLHLYKWTHRH